MDGKQIALVTVMTCFVICGVAGAQETGLTRTSSNPPDVEGFTNTTVPLSNPGGFLKATNSRSGVDVHFKPVPYLRDNWGVLFGTKPGTISFDVIALDDYTIPAIKFQLSDGGHSFRYMLRTQNVLRHPQTKADGWVRYSIP